MLNLEETGITSKGAEQLSKLRLKELKSLTVTKSEVGSEGKKILDEYLNFEVQYK